MFLFKSFSNLFSTSSAPPVRESSGKNSTGTAAVRYSASNPTSVTPALDAMRKRARAHQTGGGNDLLLLMDSDLSSERTRALRSVRAHVNRSGNGDRIQAYGWSITGGTSNSSGNKSDEGMASNAIKNTSVPVPIYCRPLSGDDVGMKIWCASAVDLTGGEAGFPNNDKTDSENSSAITEKLTKQNKDAVERDVGSVPKDPNNALADLESELSQALSEQSSRSCDSHLSTFVWICSVSHSKSKVTIVNIRSNPGEVLDSFNVKTHLLCISSIPGAKVNDMQGSDGIEVDSNEIKLVQREDSRRESIANNINKSSDQKLNETNDDSNEMSQTKQSDNSTKTGDNSKESPAKSVTLEKIQEYVLYTEPPSPTSTIDDMSTASSNVFQPMSTCLPTMWLGGQNGCLYVHSSIAQWSHCIATIKLSDSVLQIIQNRGRVFVALANGQCCVFVRSTITGEWDFTKYYVIDIGVTANIGNYNSSDSTNPKLSSNSMTSLGTNQIALYSIRCIESAKEMIWLGYRNLIFILNSKTLKTVHSFAVHPRKETQVRQLTVLGDGVWCSLRLDSTLKLYSALKPYQHLQDVDIEPYVSKMLSPKAFSFIRITALKASNNRLWIGTANGVILSLPCGKDTNASQSPTIVSSNESGRLSMSTFAPICNLSATQLSFHGHKDAVKFFVCTKNLILSGGEGYIDFRLNGDEDANSLSKGDRSHLIVWEITP